MSGYRDETETSVELCSALPTATSGSLALGSGSQPPSVDCPAHGGMDARLSVSNAERCAHFCFQFEDDRHFLVRFTRTVSVFSCFELAVCFENAYPLSVMANIAAKEARSRVTNGALFVPINGRPVDQRSAAARRYRDIYTTVCEDLGGPDHLSELQRQLARRCASLAVYCEEQESLLVDAGPEAVNIEQYLMACGTYGRLAAKLGLKRRPRDVTPDFDDYVTAKAKTQGQSNGKYR